MAVTCVDGWTAGRQADAEAVAGERSRTPFVGTEAPSDLAMVTGAGTYADSWRALEATPNGCLEKPARTARCRLDNDLLMDVPRNRKFLRAAVHLWADQSRHQCAWAQAYYQELWGQIP